MLEHLTSSPTLIHADWRADNMFINENGEIVVVDFQLVGVGNGAYDLAYFISQSVEREVRSGRERELVQIYVDMLAANGVDRDFDSVWFDFRVALGFCLAYGFASMAAFESLPGDGRSVAMSLLRRSAYGIVDLDAAGAVATLTGPDK